MKWTGMALLAVAPAVFAFPTWSRGELTDTRRAEIERIVAHDLRDPASAQFRNEYRLVSSDGDEAFCGEVNAKNAFGGYNGFVPFYYQPTRDLVVRADGDGADPQIVQWGCNPG